MARRTNFGFDKRQKEKLKQEKAAKKRERRQERKEAREAGEITIEDSLVIAPVDPADLGLPDAEQPTKDETDES
ncbi:hypothetical protein DRQ53_05955 [bacterium]|nr:MAG: hypothetical protein DRQ32_00970 [bacterium]RKZ16595.1 MAG: hypothetical protein DRQ53_05955 [bacterium]